MMKNGSGDIFNKSTNKENTRRLQMIGQKKINGEQAAGMNLWMKRNFFCLHKFDLLYILTHKATYR